MRTAPAFSPNLLIIGAGKAGTTSLHAYLDLHPSISMSRIKELALFSRDDWKDRLGWYRAQFPVRTAVRGESSPGYSVDPVVPHVPERASSVIPDARIIYMLRDPIDRLVGQYVEFVSIRQEDRPFAEAMADFDSPRNSYVMASRYGHQLDRWRACYADEQILVVDQHDLRHRRGETLRRVFRFLGVDDTFSTPEFDQLHNTRDLKLRPSDLAVRMHDRGAYLPALRACAALPERVGARLRRLLGEEIVRPTVDASLRAELEQCLREDVARIRRHTGRAFEHWSI